jgi:hypothetical protein
MRPSPLLGKSVSQPVSWSVFPRDGGWAWAGSGPGFICGGNWFPTKEAAEAAARETMEKKS